jgi:hypothetical protein
MVYGKVDFVTKEGAKGASDWAMRIVFVGEGEEVKVAKQYVYAVSF